MIGFNKPYLAGKEFDYIADAVSSLKISGNGKYTTLCQSFFEDKYLIKKALLTTSCTDALEMAALLARIQPGDEVIMPSFTFVSTANAFVLRGASIIFIDSGELHPGLDEEKIYEVVSKKTKCLVPVHYAGVACDMDKIIELATAKDLIVVEDAAQAIDSYYVNHAGTIAALGTIGHFGAFSFHETKNIISGEGGMLSVNRSKYLHRSEVIWEKGTNRSAFYRGEVDKYTWLDVGSSFLPSEIIAAFLWAQLEIVDIIQQKRRGIWQYYYESAIEQLQEFDVGLPYIPKYATNNGHMFYLVCRSLEDRSKLIAYLRERQITTVFHYLPLHRSKFYRKRHDGRELRNADRYGDCLLRLPMYFELTKNEVDQIIGTIRDYYS